MRGIEAGDRNWEKVRNVKGRAYEKRRLGQKKCDVS